MREQTAGCPLGRVAARAPGLPADAVALRCLDLRTPDDREVVARTAQEVKNVTPERTWPAAVQGARQNKGAAGVDGMTAELPRALVAHSPEVNTTQAHVFDGYHWVVDIDLAKVFDRVNHDRLMAAVAARVDDRPALQLIRRCLTAGVLEHAGGPTTSVSVSRRSCNRLTAGSRIRCVAGPVEDVAATHRGTRSSWSPQSLESPRGVRRQTPLALSVTRPPLTRGFSEVRLRDVGLMSMANVATRNPAEPPDTDPYVR